ncbi:MAG: hypothetical protein MK240_04980, partial [Opitutales bacterium]|nr:hypothetical protein [Opitutales bacterium]
YTAEAVGCGSDGTGIGRIFGFESRRIEPIFPACRITALQFLYSAGPGSSRGRFNAHCVELAFSMGVNRSH